MYITRLMIIIWITQLNLASVQRSYSLKTASRTKMTWPILFLFLLVLPNHYEALSVNHHHTWSVQSILRDLRSSFTPAPPPHTQPAKLARYIVHFSGNQFSFQSPLYTRSHYWLIFWIADWASMATISARKPTRGLPFSNPWSISDGSSLEVSSGTPYFYFTDMEMSVHDLHVKIAIYVIQTKFASNVCLRSTINCPYPWRWHRVTIAKDKLWILKIHPVLESFWVELHRGFIMERKKRLLLQMRFFQDIQICEIIRKDMNFILPKWMLNIFAFWLGLVAPKMFLSMITLMSLYQTFEI